MTTTRTQKQKPPSTTSSTCSTTSIPKKVHQDNFSPGRGNALQAAVASIFGLDLSQVPNFIEMPDGYEAAIRLFCQDSGDGGMNNCIKIKLQGQVLTSSDDHDHDHDHDDINRTRVLSEYDGKLCILRGKSPRGDFGHVVVARYRREGGKFEMVHDPHPKETFLDVGGKAGFGWCMFFV
jgi:hypothetical protein